MIIQKAASVPLCLVAFEVADADGDGDDDDVICSCRSLSPPQLATAADLQQVDRRHSLNKRQGAEAHWQTKDVIYPLSKHTGIVSEELPPI